VSTDGETLALSVHSWIVQTGRHTIVIDTGRGQRQKSSAQSDI
jgi:hypothetical protein